MKIRDRLEALSKSVPHRNIGTWQLWKKSIQMRRTYQRARLYIIMVSSLNNYRVHEILFNKQEGKNPQEWRLWFRLHLRDILANSVIPGLNVISEDQKWSVKKIIGWKGEKVKGKGRKNVKRKSRYSALVKRRNKTKRQGAKSGKNHLRRRHRDRKRRA